MNTATHSQAGDSRVLPLPRPAAEVDPDAVVVSGSGCELTFAELDRWSNRLARLLLAIGAGPQVRVAIAVDSPIEQVVAERAVVKLGGIPVAADDGSFALGTGLGVTIGERRPELTDAIDWLMLDDRSTLRHYLAGSDAPLGSADFAAAGIPA
ncbi:AMP-binding protein [Nocardia donostiensis]|uniref:AMP-dependent synthetase/ligase domain-containing protein n=1 Tax=Nocardia donostiensis TaxID=1538463 RepID=A0A1W0BGZ3_9NOCA|nr:AMP-binding protein [Nocardia donostiensis]ONM49235.1 hypothetical protein B0T46_07505 [Nocardia donostiensis]OQS14757.1 hypothetical protein B0T36_11770 [Nocardia donostiensis]OQS21759.1 hypothetical protein B0T44_06460 [Nocardia donostiensis]